MYSPRERIASEAIPKTLWPTWLSPSLKLKTTSIQYQRTPNLQILTCLRNSNLKNVCNSAYVTIKSHQVPTSSQTSCSPERRWSTWPYWRASHKTRQLLTAFLTLRVHLTNSASRTSSTLQICKLKNSCKWLRKDQTMELYILTNHRRISRRLSRITTLILQLWIHFQTSLEAKTI